MKIYRPGTHGRHTMYVRPGVEFPVAVFLNDDGTPKQFAVEFREGCADVVDNLAQYMFDRDLAKPSPLILPERA